MGVEGRTAQEGLSTSSQWVGLVLKKEGEEVRGLYGIFPFLVRCLVVKYP